MAIRLKDVAQHLQLSVSTVSAALQNREDISEATRIRVVEAVEQLGYHPNSLARGLITRKTFVLRVIVPDLSRSFFAEVLKGIDSITSPAGYNLLVCNTEENAKREKEILNMLLSNQVDGVLWLQLTTRMTPIGGRYQEQGLAGIAERSRRPHVSPRQTGGEWEQQVVELRQRYPDWGARKLQVLLRQAGVRLPASTIHRILLRRGLVRIEDRHAAALQRFERAEPNQLWQMDFKGSTGWATAVGPLSVLDDHSRYLIALRGTWTTKAEPVREQLESAFSECGVPEAMLMDHGTPWWNANAPTGATWLTVWLMRQGIELHWSGYRHPQTQGKVERFHGSLQRAQGRRGVPDEQRQQWLDQYRHEYNQVRPHEALGMQTPASRWRPSERRYDPNPRALAVSGRSHRGESRQPGPDLGRAPLGHQPGLGRTVGATSQNRGAGAGVSLPQRDPRTRSRQPTLHGRGALAGGLSSIQKCKGCVGTECKPCRGT